MSNESSIGEAHLIAMELLRKKEGAIKSLQSDLMACEIKIKFLNREIEFKDKKITILKEEIAAQKKEDS